MQVCRIDSWNVLEPPSAKMGFTLLKISSVRIAQASCYSYFQFVSCNEDKKKAQT